MNRKFCFLFFVLVAVLGCTKSMTNKAIMPNGEVTATDNESATSRDRTFTVNTVAAYEACKKEQQGYIPLRPNDPRYASLLKQAEAKCYWRAQVGGAVLGAQDPGLEMALGGLGFAPMVGPGMLAPTDPSFYPGLPGAAELLFPLRSQAQVAMDRTAGMTVPVYVTGSSANAGVMEVLHEHDQRLCEVERSQGKKPCTKAAK